MDTSYIKELERLVVAQICSHFDKASSTAVDALAEVLSRFLNEISQLSRRQTEIAGRTLVNTGDVLCTLKRPQFSFVSSLDDFRNFDVPFAHTLPPRPFVRRVPKRAPSFRELGSSDLAHVPTFFPAVPDQHTLKCSPACEVVDKMRECIAVAKHNSLSKFMDGYQKIISDSRDDQHGNTIIRESSGLPQRELLSDVMRSSQDQCTVTDHHCSLDEIRVHSKQKRSIKISGTKRKKCCARLTEMVPFREGSTMIHADHETVEKLISGQISVFENV